MNVLRSPRNKLLFASAAIVVLALLAPMKGVSAATSARVVLGAAAVAGLGYWYLRQKRAAFTLAEVPTLKVLARTGLSQRCGMALVDADGHRYLVIHGDGFAELHPAEASAPARLQGRRPRPARRPRKSAARKAGAR